MQGQFYNRQQQDIFITSVPSSEDSFNNSFINNQKTPQRFMVSKNKKLTPAQMEQQTSKKGIDKARLKLDFSKLQNIVQDQKNGNNTIYSMSTTADGSVIGGGQNKSNRSHSKNNASMSNSKALVIKKANILSLAAQGMIKAMNKDVKIDKNQLYKKLENLIEKKRFKANILKGIKKQIKGKLTKGDNYVNLLRILVASETKAIDLDLFEFYSTKPIISKITEETQQRSHSISGRTYNHNFFTEPHDYNKVFVVSNTKRVNKINQNSLREQNKSALTKSAERILTTMNKNVHGSTRSILSYYQMRSKFTDLGVNISRNNGGEEEGGSIKASLSFYN